MGKDVFCKSNYNFSAEYDRIYGYGVCFGPNSTVMVEHEDGYRERTLCPDVRRGDRLVVADGGTAAVVCVVKT